MIRRQLNIPLIHIVSILRRQNQFDLNVQLFASYFTKTAIKSHFHSISIIIYSGLKFDCYFYCWLFTAFIFEYFNRIQILNIQYTLRQYVNYLYEKECVQTK